MTMPSGQSNRQRARSQRYHIAFQPPSGMQIYRNRNGAFWHKVWKPDPDNLERYEKEKRHSQTGNRRS